MKIKKIITVLMLFTFIIASANSKDNKEEIQKRINEIAAEKVVKEKKPTIVGIAAANENFTTLVAAVKTAGFVEILNGNSPFTVFAPLNSAFDKLPEGTVEGFLKLESKDALSTLLIYHVVAGEFKAADVLKAIEDNKGNFAITTVQGGTLMASLVDGECSFN